MDQFEVVVSKAEALTPRIREFVLARANGAPMPGWAAGAHIDVHLPDVGRRSYSLIETASPRAAAFFATLNGANRYAVLFRVQVPKKPETRARKIEELILMLEQGRKIHG